MISIITVFGIWSKSRVQNYTGDLPSYLYEQKL